MIEMQGRSFRPPFVERSMAPSGWTASVSAPVDLDDGVQAPLQAYADGLRVRFGATAVAFVWHDELAGAKCIATSGVLSVSKVMRSLSARSWARGEKPQPRWQWSRLPDCTDDWLQIEFPLASGSVTVVGSVADDLYGRERLELALPELVEEAAPFFHLCEVTLRSQASAGRLRAAANLSAVGIVIVDAYANVLFANDAAERICDESRALRLTDDVIRATALSDSLRLQAAIEHVVSGRDSSTLEAPVIALNRARGRPVMLSVNPMGSSALQNDQAAAILCIFDPECNFASSIKPACEFHRLSAMESRVAELMVKGHSITEAADRLGIKEYTARSYLKQIFQKTGTNRQGELVALLLRASVQTVPQRNMRLVD
ncbi:helix-turn-helix transcriptional regulator [Novosphingobium sp. PS1R-30]|uniref:Helix-turn-helix transcriptional regulator n=1 Tax=Novosphingobium anseongense TaxID=3133436 RepID=A0ABU8RVI0_9SPHN